MPSVRLETSCCPFPSQRPVPDLPLNMPGILAAPLRSIRQHPLLAICGIGFALRLGLVFAFPFEVRADEIFQYAEPAHRLLTGDGIITWEWRIGLRSWILPGVIAGLMALSATLGLGHALVFVQAVFAAFSVLLIVVAWHFGKAVAGRRGALVCAALMSAWPAPVIFASRTLTEAQGGTLLAIGTLWAATSIARRRAPGPVSSFLIGLTLTLGTVLRIQFAPACGAALVGCAMAWRTSRPALVCLVMGMIVPVFLSGFVDLMTLGSPFESSIRNFSINYVQHKADLYGIRSGFYYAGKIASHWGGMALIIISLAAFSLRA